MAAFKKLPGKELALDLLCDVACGILHAVSVSMFTAPNQIAPGGVTGLATVVNYLTELPIGVVSMLINIPLFFLAFRLLGRRFTLSTLKSTVIMSLFIDLGAYLLPVYQGNLLLVSVIGGVTSGVGLGLVFMRGSTTGGTDILGKLIKLKRPHIPFGKVMLAVDGMVIAVAALVFRNMESAFYAIITIFASSHMIDMILYGMDKGKIVHIISEQTGEIAKAIIHDMDRSATLLKSAGAYSGRDGNMLLCVVRDNEYPTLKKLILRIDPRAFVFVSDAGEVLGEGFRGLDAEKI